MRQRITNATEINKQSKGIPIREQLITDQFDPWQAVPKMVFLSFVFQCVCCGQLRWLCQGNGCDGCSYRI